MVVGPGSVAWLDRASRPQDENTQLAIDKIQVAEDAVIADVGAGSGYYTFKLAPKVPKGKVYAVEIQDEMIAAILGEQETAARGYVDNLKARGVVTDSGYNAALNNLLNQRAGAQAKLSDIGTGILETGRGGAENLANSFRSVASNLDLGDVFDPYSKGADLNSYFSDFFNNLGTKLRGAAPTNLFDTSGLATLAGAAQGAGNTAFDPRAVAGIFGDDEDEEEEETTSPF